MLEGARSGVRMGMTIIPGVLIICTVVMLLNNGMPSGGIYTGSAYEGIGFIPMAGEKLKLSYNRCLVSQAQNVLQCR